MRRVHEATRAFLVSAGTLLAGVAPTAGCGPTEAQIVSPGDGCGGCGTNEYCDEETRTCACSPGFRDDGAACVSTGGEGGERSRAEVCRRWKEGHQVSSPTPFVAGSGMCGLGAVPEAAIDDTLRRLALFRWLSGLDAVENDAAFDADAQACSVVSAWWDFSRPISPHTPPSDSTCWTVEGARGAGTSNIAWGSSSAADAIDGFMEDAGANNVDALGHRRWILNPPLGPVGIGYWSGGGAFGNASCLRVFASRPGVRGPAWNAVPPAGYAPIEMARWTWSFQGSLSGISGADVTVTKDGETMPIEVRRLQLGAGEPAVSWVPVGWSPQVNVTYEVTVSGVGPTGEVKYETTPVDCS